MDWASTIQSLETVSFGKAFLKWDHYTQQDTGSQALNKYPQLFLKAIICFVDFLQKIFLALNKNLFSCC